MELSDFGLLCRTSFADHVKSQLRQYDPWRALYGRHGSKIDTSSHEMSLSYMPSRLVWTYNYYMLALLEWDSYIANPNRPNRRYLYCTKTKILINVIFSLLKLKLKLKVKGITKNNTSRYFSTLILYHPICKLL